jgi:hypothetical protein
MSQIKRGTTAEQLVSETDHVQLSRLVNEHAWRADNGRADTIHELYIDDSELIIGPSSLRGREAILEWGRQLVANPPWRVIRHVCGKCGSLATGRTQPKVRRSSRSSWLQDRRRPQLNLSASVRIMIASSARKKDGDLSRVVGLSSSREVTF